MCVPTTHHHPRDMNFMPQHTIYLINGLTPAVMSFSLLPRSGNNPIWDSLDNFQIVMASYRLWKFDMTLSGRSYGEGESRSRKGAGKGQERGEAKRKLHPT